MKKVVIIILCAFVAVISALSLYSFFQNSSSEQNEDFINAVQDTTEKTEMEIHLFSTAPAISYAGWESWDFPSCYHEIIVDGVTYSADPNEAVPIAQEKLGSVLYEFQWDDYRFTNNEKAFTVAIYEIKDTEKEKAIAIGRKDGLQNGYFLYSSDIYNLLVNSKTLADFCEGWASYSVQSSSWVTYEQDGKEDTIYSLGYAARNIINDFIESNGDKRAEERKSQTGERLCFETSTGGINSVIDTYLCADGYLYISCGKMTVGYNVGTDEYNRFMKDFQGTTCIWTPEHPVTMG